MFKHGLSGQLWPIHFRPNDDELLSSWLVRLIHRYGADPVIFCASIWHSTRFWNRDIDKGNYSDVLRLLAVKTATSPERVLATTFRGYTGFMVYELTHTGPTGWLLTSRTGTLVRHRPWLQYCPHCLREDADPYFRRQWRLAFVTVCCQHHRRLLDSCPRCGGVVNFHRFPDKAKPITLCYRCRFDLRQAHAPALPQTDACHRLLEFQPFLIDMMQQGQGTLADSLPVQAEDYFLVLQKLSRLLVTGKQAPLLRKVLCQHSRQPCFELNSPSHKMRALESVSVADRFQLMKLLAWWLAQWPNRFIAFCVDADLRFTQLVQGMPIRPQWYEPVARQLYNYRYLN